MRNIVPLRRQNLDSSYTGLAHLLSYISTDHTQSDIARVSNGHIDCLGVWFDIPLEEAHRVKSMLTNQVLD